MTHMLAWWLQHATLHGTVSVTVCHPADSALGCTISRTFQLCQTMCLMSYAPSVHLSRPHKSNARVLITTCGTSWQWARCLHTLLNLMQNTLLNVAEGNGETVCKAPNGVCCRQKVRAYCEHLQLYRGSCEKCLITTNFRTI